MIDIREDFQDMMLNFGIPLEEIQSMTDQEFEMTVSALLDENSPRNVNHRHPMREIQPLQNQQNIRTAIGAPYTNDAGFGNGNYDDDEALRMAIEQSLDDQLIPPHMRHRPSPRNEVSFQQNQRNLQNQRLIKNHQYPSPDPTPLPTKGQKPTQQSSDISEAKSSVPTAKKRITSSTTTVTTTAAKAKPLTSTRTTAVEPIPNQRAKKVGPEPIPNQRAKKVGPEPQQQRGSRKPQSSQLASNLILKSCQQQGNTSSSGTPRSKQTGSQKGMAVPRQTFISEAILDPTYDILHPTHKTFAENVDNDDFGDSIFGYESPSVQQRRIYQQLKKENQMANADPLNDRPQPPKLSPQRDVKFSDSQIIRDMQDIEYIMAQEQAAQKEREEKAKKEEEEHVERLLKMKQENRFNESKRLFDSLPEEPQKGTMVAIQMPNGQRVVRRFDPKSKGIMIYAWISGQTLGLQEPDILFIDSFELVTTFGHTNVVVKNKTLEEQQITGRVFLAITVF